MDKEILIIQEAAEYLRVSVTTLKVIKGVRFIYSQKQKFILKV